MAELEKEPLVALGFKAIEMKCHQVRSTASLFGASEFAASLGTLENAAKRSDTPASLDEIAVLSDLWLATRKTIAPKIDTAPVAE